jgi:hypothetical protein
MNHSNSSLNSTSSRATLKLKTGIRKSPRESETPAISRPRDNIKLKPGAHWSDEYKERMQADMDALTRPYRPPSTLSCMRSFSNCAAIA